MAHSRELVARIKGALLAGIKPKAISYHTGIPVDTINAWVTGERRAAIEPDPAVAQDIRSVLLGAFNGDPKTR